MLESFKLSLQTSSPEAGMRIEIICTGDEILTGKTVNTNFSHISRKLEGVGMSVSWGTTVGDNRDTLLEAFRLAGDRSDAVIVNGGLGPTVDDLSQEIAAKAAGVNLVLNEHWLERIEAVFRQLHMVMQPNNRKQALLPATAEIINNPIGTACGFELNIGRARFYFTPGVPKELYLMLDAEVIPRLLARSGTAAISRVKRFHTFGLGESHADSLLEGIEGLAPNGDVKLGFQSHFPQLETKLALRGAEPAELARRLLPIEAEVRKRLGNFIVAEDDDTLEGVILAALKRKGASLSVVETFTGGGIAARLAPLPDAESVFRRGLVAQAGSEIESLLNLAAGTLSSVPLTEKAIKDAARATLLVTDSTYALVALADQDRIADSAARGPTLWFSIATGQQVAVRSSRLLRFGDKDFLRAGAVEMGLDSLRRFLQGLPVDEKHDFGQ
jgi:nicotinamide-nucleotide amidase